MKAYPLLGLLLFFSGPIAAQYFSEGWSPGQQVVQNPVSGGWSPDQPVPTNNVPTQSTSGSFQWSKFLTSGPVGAILNSAGINITQNIEDAVNREASRWDKRIPIITDDNYHDIIVNEPCTEQEEKDRVWFLIITVARGQTGGFSEMVDSTFDAAYNSTVAENDLKNVRWGRIDYMNVTALTTKWAVWQGPRLVIATDRGKSLRFFKPKQIRLGEETIRNWLKDEDWKQYEPWNTEYAPGGDKEWLMDYFALATTYYYNVISRIPKWLLLILSGSIGSILLGFFHKSSPARPNQRQTVNPAPNVPRETRSPPPKPDATPITPSKPKNERKPRKGKK